MIQSQPREHVVKKDWNKLNVNVYNNYPDSPSEGQGGFTVWLNFSLKYSVFIILVVDLHIEFVGTYKLCYVLRGDLNP
jgi:hypothetical protein